MSTKRRGRDFESNYLAMRRRMQSLGTAVIPAPATIGAHTHHAREIVSDPFDLTAADDVQEAIEELNTEKLARSGVQPMLGDLNMNSFFIYEIDALKFELAPENSPVEGALQWADTSGIERLVMTGSGGVQMPVGGVYIKVRNDTGSTINARTPVIVSSSDAALNLLEVERADVTMAVNSKVMVGLTMQSIANGTKGWACRLGYAGGLDFSAYSAGLQLYVDGLGTMSGSPPSKGCGARIRMGVVINPANPGSMWVDPDWRPDLDELANVDIGRYASKQYYDVPMWLQTPDGEPCDAWRDYPASRFPMRVVIGDDDVLIKDVVLLVEANASDAIITLPEITYSLADSSNRWVRIKKRDGAYRVRVQTSGSDTINGDTEVALLKIGEVLDLMARNESGTVWEIV